MPFSRLAFLLAFVVAAAAATVWVASMVSVQGLSDARVLAVVLPVALIAAYLVRRRQ